MLKLRTLIVIVSVLAFTGLAFVGCDNGNNVTTPTALAAPANLSITETGIASWDTVTGAIGYIVNANGTQRGQVDASTTQFNLTTAANPALTAGTQYTITVIARGDGTTRGNSAPSGGPRTTA